MRFDRIKDHRAFRPGYDVDQNSTRFSNYYHLLRELVHWHNGWIPRAAPLDVKYLLGIHVYEDAVFVSSIKQRLKELRYPTEYPAAPGPKLSAVLDFIGTLSTWEEYVACIYNVIKPSLIDAWEFHFESTDPILDEPTTRLLADFLRITPEHISGGMALFEEMMSKATCDPAKVSAATNKMRDLWAGLGADPFALDIDKKTRRKLKAFPRIVNPARDSFCKITEEGDTFLPKSIYVNGAENHVPTDRVEMQHYFHALLDAEITAAEIIALDSHENPDMPWRFHEDMARQTWDEIRHAQVMEKVLDHLGVKWGEHELTFRFFHKIYKHDLLGRLVLFNRQSEGNSMWRHGRRRQVMLERGATRAPGEPDYTKIAQVFDYVLADEVAHVHNGVYWGTHLLGGSKQAFAEKVKELTAAAGKVDDKAAQKGARGFEKADEESEALVEAALAYQED